MPILETSKLWLRQRTWSRRLAFEPRSRCTKAQVAASLSQPPGHEIVERSVVPFAPLSSHPIFLEEDTQVPTGARLGPIFLLPNWMSPPPGILPVFPGQELVNNTDFHPPVQPPALPLSEFWAGPGNLYFWQAFWWFWVCRLPSGIWDP